MPKVLITGANRGLGLEFARQYAANGWEVVATARQSSGDLDSLGVRVEQLDMSDLDSVARFGDRLDSLDLLIANAGTDYPKQSETAEDGRAWAEMMVINCIAPFLLARSVLPLIAQSRGKLIAISSRMGSIADNGSGGYVPYRSSKAALNAAWRSLALDVRPQGVVAAVLHPGWVQTRMGGPNAPLPAEDSIAAMREVIDSLGLRQSGGFFDQDGSAVPW
jgi:NAD(P)-dependent dehydrogenase (short-subunit alcohol dehydrogenase family)